MPLDLDDNALDRGLDAVIGGLLFGGLQFIGFDVPGKTGDCEIAFGLLDFQRALVHEQPQAVHFRFGNALRIAALIELTDRASSALATSTDFLLKRTLMSFSAWVLAMSSSIFTRSTAMRASASSIWPSRNPCSTAWPSQTFRG